MRRWVVFGKVIPSVRRPRAPIKAELFLICTVSQPVKSHIHGFRAFWLDTIVDDALGRGVIGLYGRGRLFVAQFL